MFLSLIEISSLQQDLGKALKTQVSDLIQDQSDQIDLLQLSVKKIEAVTIAYISVKTDYETFCNGFSPDLRHAEFEIYAIIRFV